MTKVNQLDFTGTTIYCGLDVHKISWRVNLKDTELDRNAYGSTWMIPVQILKVKQGE